MGPMVEKPFYPSIHCAPLMDQPKRDSRHVIADLTFPEHLSVNAYSTKNPVWGKGRPHSLPTVQEFVDKLRDMGRHTNMSTVDILRAYKNFRSKLTLLQNLGTII